VAPLVPVATRWISDTDVLPASSVLIWYFMRISGVFLDLDVEDFAKLVRGISIGKLKTYQIYEGFKVRTHLQKVNTESLRKATPRFRARIAEGDEEFAKELAQCILVSQLAMVIAVLDFLGIPHEDGFFSKDADPKALLSEGWEDRVFQAFRGKFTDTLLLFYINHLRCELLEAAEPFRPSATVSE
jgi:hypothetical protein